MPYRIQLAMTLSIYCNHIPIARIDLFLGFNDLAWSGASLVMLLFLDFQASTSGGDFAPQLDAGPFLLEESYLASGVIAPASVDGLNHLLFGQVSQRHWYV